MDLAKNNHIDNIKTNEVITFPVEKIDTSWMSKSQQKLFDIVKIEENRTKKITEITRLAGYKYVQIWHTAIKDIRFKNLMIDMGVAINNRKTNLKKNSEIEYIKNPSERLEYFKKDIWDLRYLYEEYPRHRKPSAFIVDFSYINNNNIKSTLKKYAINILATYKATSVVNMMERISHFIKTMQILYPNINSFNQLQRDIHVENIINNIDGSSNIRRLSLQTVKQMFNYMYINKWEDGPNTNSLIISYDMPTKQKTLPRPIPPNIKLQLDEYLDTKIIPLLEKNEPTPIMDSAYWDFLIILRYSGRRFEDITHLLSDNTSKDCLRYDLDGDPQMYIDHRIAKIPKDLVIPLAHLNNYSSFGNIVERAILRQKERVKNLDSTSDGNLYLFREILKNNKGTNIVDKNDKIMIDVIRHDIFNITLLNKVSEGIPLLNTDGSIHQISTHQFRHTVATEMIDAGVDIYAVKEFLGHSSIAMTEQYIKVYQQRLKKEFKEKLSKTDATDIKNNLSEQEELYDNKWVKNKIIGVFELGDGCCEHPYKMPSCPHMACKTCFKKKIYPRHLHAVKNTIESETIHRDNALRMGLNEKAEEFDKVVNFYTVALEIITKDEVFEASKHFYNKGV